MLMNLRHSTVYFFRQTAPYRCGSASNCHEALSIQYGMANAFTPDH